MPITSGLLDFVAFLLTGFSFSLEVFLPSLLFFGLLETDSVSTSNFDEAGDNVGDTTVAKDCSSLITPLTFGKLLRFRFDLFSDESSSILLLSLLVESDLLFLLFNGDGATESIDLFISRRRLTARSFSWFSCFWFGGYRCTLSQRNCRCIFWNRRQGFFCFGKIR